MRSKAVAAQDKEELKRKAQEALEKARLSIANIKAIEPIKIVKEKKNFESAFDVNEKFKIKDHLKNIEIEIQEVVFDKNTKVKLEILDFSPNGSILNEFDFKLYDEDGEKNLISSKSNLITKFEKLEYGKTIDGYLTFKGVFSESYLVIKGRKEIAIKLREYKKVDLLQLTSDDTFTKTLLKSKKLSKVADEILKLKRNAIIFEKSSKPTKSKFGGKPDLLKGTHWPSVEHKGERVYIPFLCQIDLKEVSVFDLDNVLPKKGLISIFYLSSLYAYKLGLKSEILIVKRTEIENLESLDYPVDLPDQYRKAVSYVTFSSQPYYPYVESAHINGSKDSLQLNEIETEEYIEIYNMLKGKNLLLGYPTYAEYPNGFDKNNGQFLQVDDSDFGGRNGYLFLYGNLKDLILQASEK